MVGIGVLVDVMVFGTNIVWAMLPGGETDSR